MVTNAQNYGSSSRGALGCNGIADWLVQRKTAIIMGLYLAYIIYFFCSHSPLVYQDWLGLFQPVALKVVHLIVLACLLSHVWIGLWIIATDYIKRFKTRTLFLLACKLVLLSNFIWGIYILYMV